MYTLLSRVLFAVAHLNIIILNVLKARRSSICFIRDAVANDVNNADLDVDLPMPIEELPKLTSTLYESQNIKA
jgi:hypothetical protein